MKSKFSRFLGVGLAVIVLVSTFVVATPAFAGNASWTADSPLNQPTVAARDVLDMAVASNGATAYAVTSDNRVYKSTNAGASWSNLTGFTAGAATKVAVAPDVADGSFVAVIVNGTQVYVSSNGGTSFSAMAAVGALQLNSIAVGPALGTSRTLAVAGDVSTGVAGVWYFTSGGDFGGGTAGWIEALTNSDWILASVSGTSTNVAARSSGLAVKFSPNFLQDRTLVAITTDNVGGASLNLANIATKKWNGDYTVYGAIGGGVVIPGATAVTSAAVDLPGSYMAFDATLRVTYMALVGTGGGLYRNTTALSTVPMKSVAVNAAGDKLVAGSNGDNTVYRLAAPATALSTAVAASSKAPSYTGTGRTTVEFFGANVGAATTTVAGAAAPNDETAFGLSGDDGKSFNDVAFIDTTANVKDLSVKSDGSKLYLVTENPGNSVTSVWRKTTAWERIYKFAGLNYIARAAMDNFDVLFVAATGTTSIWYSNDAGQTAAQPRIAYENITDLEAESATVIYVLSGTQVSKAVDGGYLWDNPITTTGAGTGASMTIVAKDNVLVAGTTGIAYTTSGSSNWTSTGLGFANAQFAVADKLSTGGVITAVAGPDIKTFTIGTSTAFASADTIDAGYAATGMVLSAGVTYVVANNNVNSQLYRSKITDAWTTTTVTPVAPATAVTFIGLTAASGKLMSMNTADKSIWSYTDIFAAAGPAVTGPAAGFLDPINEATGSANNVIFQWTAITGSPTSTRYNLQIALDSAFTQVVYGGTGFTPISDTLAIVGPTGVTGLQFPFQADTTYYWRVRVSAPVDSPWSASPRSFKIDTLKPLNIVSPASGSNDVPAKPTFVWTVVPGATTYEIVVSDDPTFKIITFSRTTDKPEFASDEALAYSTVYYWRVRASAPATAVTPFVNGIFTTEAKPLPPTTNPPPVTVTNVTPTVTVNLPPPTEAIPAYFLWLIIGIGAILVIALIVLIVRTRRSA